MPPLRAVRVAEARVQPRITGTMITGRVGSAITRLMEMLGTVRTDWARAREAGNVRLTCMMKSQWIQSTPES
jgi:hypothetical protein